MNGERLWAGLPCVVQLMPEKESAWWLNMVLRAGWPVFLRDFLNKVVVPKLAPWFLQKYKPPVLVSPESISW
jgi:hypothetical protein